jgi:WD40 repeat protein
MFPSRRVFPSSLLILLLPSLGANAQQTVSYAKQVKPFLARYCLECHNAGTMKGDLDLETFKGLMLGGKNGAVVVPGKPDESRLVLQPEGKAAPAMPPKKARQPRPKEVAVLRAWVAAGAKDDSSLVRVSLPEIKLRVKADPPIRALAYRPDGKLLAAGVHRDVILVEPATSEHRVRLTASAGKVTALAFSHNGQLLAVARSVPGTTGMIQVHRLVDGLPGERPTIELIGHRDAIHDVAFSPDDNLLATTGYDRLIKLWDLASGKEVRTLKDHSDAVYGLAFSPDGKLLASGGADRAVKVWNVASGTRLYTLGEATDWVYAVAWSPDGRHLAAGGVDKSIRVWEVSPAGGRIAHSVFAHEAPVLRLAYAADGRTLFSLGEDRIIKAWDTAHLVERKVYDAQPDTTLALAVRPDHKQLALGRFDGALVLLNAATGNVEAQPLPYKPKPPQLAHITPTFGQRGQSVSLTLEGKHFDGDLNLVADYPGVRAKILADGRSAHSVRADVTFPALTPVGTYSLRVRTKAGESAALPFIVDPFPEIKQAGTNDSMKTAQRVTLPASISGTLGRAGMVDFYRFQAEGGQEIGMQAVVAAVGSRLEPVLQLTDSTGRVLAESDKGILGHVCERSESYVLSIRDKDFRGGPNTHYRLHVGPFPIVTSVFPLGVQRGTEADVQLHGVNLGSARSVHLRVPAAAAVGSRLTVPIKSPHGTPVGDASVLIGEFPEVMHSPTGSVPSILIPGVANGRIDQDGATEVWHFHVSKGERLFVEVNARRLGSPLDSYLEILDPRGQPVPRATLRCIAKTYVTFRDHDSKGAGIRLETWNELAMNDYLWVGSELLRIHELPKNPDDDCQFFSAGDQRLGYLDTTPTHISLGSPMYKVTIHPPGTSFPPNGFPVIRLDYRNDDGGPGFGKDSRLTFDPPADGDYQVRIGDSRGQGGNEFAYRLTVRPPRPNFTVSFSPTAPTVWKGGAVPITVSADRSDGFEGAIEIRLEHLPPGFSAPPTSIPEGESSTALALWADPTAQTPANLPPLRLVARATIDGKEVVREFSGGLPRVQDPGDLITTTEQSEVTVVPGSQVWMTARIERRKGFKGRVPLDVRGLPHGVRVLDIGLNGILITEKESSRSFAIYAEPWVKPIAHAFVVLARHEGKDAEYAAKSVLLRVNKPSEGGTP